MVPLSYSLNRPLLLFVCASVCFGLLLYDLCSMFIDAADPIVSSTESTRPSAHSCVVTRAQPPLLGSRNHTQPPCAVEWNCCASAAAATVWRNWFGSYFDWCCTKLLEVVFYTLPALHSSGKQRFDWCACSKGQYQEAWRLPAACL